MVPPGFVQFRPPIVKNRTFFYRHPCLGQSHQGTAKVSWRLCLKTRLGSKEIIRRSWFMQYVQYLVDLRFARAARLNGLTKWVRLSAQGTTSEPPQDHRNEGLGDKERVKRPLGRTAFPGPLEIHDERVLSRLDIDIWWVAGASTQHEDHNHNQMSI